MTSRASRLLTTGVPVILLVVFAFAAITGDHGLVRRYQLQRELGEKNATLAALEHENQLLTRELLLMERDPDALEREVAESLGWAEPGTVVYRFVDAEDAQRPLSPLEMLRARRRADEATGEAE